jgi:hypothetical protein
MRPFVTVLTEAVVIGILNYFIILLFGKIKPDLNGSAVHFASGALIHIIFEYAGGNRWWCLTTYK